MLSTAHPVKTAQIVEGRLRLLMDSKPMLQIWRMEGAGLRRAIFQSWLALRRPISGFVPETKS